MSLGGVVGDYSFLVNALTSNFKESKLKKPILFIIGGTSSQKDSVLSDLLKEMNVNYISSDVIKQKAIQARIPNLIPAIGLIFKEVLMQGFKKRTHLVIGVDANIPSFTLIAQLMNKTAVTVFETVAIYPTFLPSDHLKSSIDIYFTKPIHRELVTPFEIATEKLKMFKDFRLLMTTLEKKTSSEVILMLNDYSQEFLLNEQRPHKERVDKSTAHRPFLYNNYTYAGGNSSAASLIRSKILHPSLPNFVACPFPNAETKGKFWEMIYKSPDINTLFMLNNLNDVVQNPGDLIPYWPLKKGDIVEETGVSIELQEIVMEAKDDKESIFRRTFKLTGSNGPRIIEHYWVEGIVDGNTLQSRKLMFNLFELIRNRHKEDKNWNPLVHCAAGIGRTGWFIGSYIAYQLTLYSDAFLEEDKIALEILIFLRTERYLALFTPAQFDKLKSLVQLFLMGKAETKIPKPQ
jgi:protein tyrosine phosphatase